MQFSEKDSDVRNNETISINAEMITILYKLNLCNSLKLIPQTKKLCNYRNLRQLDEVNLINNDANANIVFETTEISLLLRTNAIVIN